MSTNDPTDPPAIPESWKDDETEVLRVEQKSKKIWWVIGVVVVALIGGVAYAVISNGGVSPQRAWPEATGGRPAGLGQEKDTAADVTPTAAPGAYIWQSFDGWHLWLVNGDGVRGAKGTITSSDTFNRATSSAPDAGTVSVDGKTITFDLSADAPVAGVDFDAGFSRKLTFTLDTPDGKVPVKLIRLGSGAKAVDANPVVIDKPVVR